MFCVTLSVLKSDFVKANDSCAVVRDCNLIMSFFCYVTRGLSGFWEIQAFYFQIFFKSAYVTLKFIAAANGFMRVRNIFNIVYIRESVKKHTVIEYVTSIHTL